MAGSKNDPAVRHQELSLSFNDDHWEWAAVRAYSEARLRNAGLAPRKYKLTDYITNLPQFHATVTQKDKDGMPLHPFSVVVFQSYRFIDALMPKVLSLPDIRRMVFLSMPHQEIPSPDSMEALADLLERFRSLQSVVIPVEFTTFPLILLALAVHPDLAHIELVDATGGFTSPRLVFPLVLGLSGVRDRLHKIAIPASILSPELIHCLGNMPRLQHLKITAVVGRGGDRFVEMISEHGISSAHTFHELRVLDVGATKMIPSNLETLAAHFPDIEYV